MGDEDQTKKTHTQGQATNSNGQQSGKKRKKQKEVAIYGTYSNYYPYRIEKGSEDPRIKIIKKEWFEDKDCLDVGCNSGLITITIAKNFGCRKILGVDLDSTLIKKACSNLSDIVEKTEPKKQNSMVDKSKDDEKNGINNSQDKTTSENSGDSCSHWSEKVFFKKENFVHSFLNSGKKYDTILCLSVAKWIQLNWGDEGLITLFSKVWKLLQPGGVFILEPQQWKSYVSNRQVSEIASTNFKNLEIFPERFQEILLDKIGFREIEDLSASLSGSKEGFNRPVLALWTELKF